MYLVFDVPMTSNAAFDNLFIEALDSESLAPPWYCPDNPIDLSHTTFGPAENRPADINFQDIDLLRKALALLIVDVPTSCIMPRGLFSSNIFGFRVVGMCAGPSENHKDFIFTLVVQKNSGSRPSTLRSLKLTLEPLDGRGIWNSDIVGETYAIDSEMTFFRGVLPGVRYRFKVDGPSESSKHPSDLTSTIRA